MNNFNSYLAQGIGSLPSSLISAILILISILMLTIALERGYILFRANMPLIAEEGRALLALIAAKKYDQAREYCTGKLHPAFRTVARILENRSTNDDLEALAREEMVAEQTSLERFTSFLGTTTTLAPMLGLLGTVTGMIKAFSAFAAASQRSQQLTIGIHEALITTTLGLMIAIPALVFFNYYVRRTNQLMDECEALVERVVKELA
ncbi:MAG: MotA/TolQ/ExbB proton channel family protein [Leptospiraceae bacterium]|nr:MotA/TolQ/ExbB proton channel family protein [Leptospiraceae bacterium]